MSNVLTANSKTLVSIDFSRNDTCQSICSYCYVDKMERLYKNYGPKIKRNHIMAKKTPKTFAKQANTEYKKLRKSKAKRVEKLEKLPVRIYGAGDYIPEHYEVLENLEFPFFMISKSLTSKNLRKDITKISVIPKLTKLLLSFDSDNLKLYRFVKKYRQYSKVSFCFTGTPNEFTAVKEKGYEFDLYFCTDKTKAAKQTIRSFREHCPENSGLIHHEGACTFCNKCWRSEVTRIPGWNSLNI